MLVDRRVELLTERQCRDLLMTEQIGRVALSIGALPAIFPVTYWVSDGDICFHTGPGTKQRAAIRGSVVGFEVDHIDPRTGTGWSVMVVGVAREQPEPEPEPEPEPGASGPPSAAPWAGGDGRHLVRIRPEVVSGRRMIARP